MRLYSTPRDFILDPFKRQQPYVRSLGNKLHRWNAAGEAGGKNGRASRSNIPLRAVSMLTCRRRGFG